MHDCSFLRQLIIVIVFWTIGWLIGMATTGRL
jgi:hypothetical protein